MKTASDVAGNEVLAHDRENGIVRCMFRRPITPSDANSLSFMTDLNTVAFLRLAVGDYQNMQSLLSPTLSFSTSTAVDIKSVSTVRSSLIEVTFS